MSDISVIAGKDGPIVDEREVDRFLGERGLSQAALNATYVRPQANTFIPIGTSVTESGKGPGSNAPLTLSNRGYQQWALILLDQRLKMIRNAGIAGNTTAQMLARIQADVIAHGPSWCVIEPGPNDASSNFTPAQTMSNITAMVNALRASGIRTVVGTITPASTHTAPQKQSARDTNTLIRDYAMSTPGVVLVDFDAAVTDPATGAWFTNYVEDGVHPAQDGAAVMGAALADALEPFVPPLSRWTAASTDVNNLLLNGRFNGSTAGLATSWGIGAGNADPLTYSAQKLTRTGIAPGEDQQITFGPGNVGLLQLSSTIALPNSRLASGDIVTALLQFERSDYMVQAAKPQYMQLNLIAVGASGEMSRAVGLYRISSELFLKNWPTFGTLITPPMTYDPAWTSLVFQAAFSGIDSGKIRTSFAAVISEGA